MSQNLLEVWLYRILSGHVKVRVADVTYFLRGATVDEKLEAAEHYEEAFEQGRQCGLFDQATLIKSITDAGVWSAENESQYQTCVEKLPQLKIKYFEMFDNPFWADKSREVLRDTRKLHAKLHGERSSLNHQSLEYYATSVKIKYVVGCSLLRSDKKTPVYTGTEFMDAKDSLVDEVIAESSRYKPSEDIIRNIARNEPWRSIWACRHNENGVFGSPTSALTDEQRYLAVWSRLYDNSYEDPEHPSDAVYADDDAFDGWLLMKKSGAAKGDDISNNPNISGAGEVFVMKARPGEESSSLTPRERDELAKQMSPEAVQARKARAEAVQQAGTLLEADMPDTKARLAHQLRLMGAKHGG